MKPEKIATYTITTITSVIFYVVLVLGTWYQERFPGATAWAHWLAWVFAVISFIMMSLVFGMTTYGRSFMEKNTLVKKESREKILKSYKLNKWYKYFWSIPLSAFILVTYFHMGWYILFTLGVVSVSLQVVSYFTLNDLVKDSLKIAKAVELE
jgi:hypothetical protein